MKHFLSRVFFFIVKLFAYCFVGGFIVIITAFIFYLHNQADLKIWHEVFLDKEFTVNSPVNSFQEYLALEERLFEQLDLEVYEQIPEQDHSLINRYSKGSKADPGHWQSNWNRTFSLQQTQPRAGILLIHGMSDSPYLMRSLAEQLHDAGDTVIALRLPGHGTAPSGLVHVTWQDMAKAVRLAMLHLQEQVGDRPLYLVGFSTGGALSVNYALASLQDSVLPTVQGIVLLSPAIGLGPEAALAIWQDRLGRWLGLDKLAWNAILPEYDPFKYNSFAINAGDLVYRLTLEIQDKINDLKQDKLHLFPPVLAFQSLVDATVSTHQLVAGLFNRLLPRGHELVIFDINRKLEVEYLLTGHPGADLAEVLRDEQLPFAVSVLTNRDPDTFAMVVKHKAERSNVISEHNTTMVWPKRIFSLSHVALPVPEADPLYGAKRAPGSKQLHLGELNLRGERGVLQVSGNDMLRLRWNPFYPYVHQRIFEFLDLPQTMPVTLP